MLRLITWNVARRSSRLAEQAASLASRELDVVALQEVTDGTLPLWTAVLERIGLPHIRASLNGADPSREPASRRRTGVLVGSRAALRDPSVTLPVPWAETAVAAVADTAIGPVEIHCLHVPNAANGWVKAHTLQAVRAGLQVAPRMSPRGVRRSQHSRVASSRAGRWSPSRETHAGDCGPSADPNGTKPSSASYPGCATSATETPIAPSRATDRASRAGPGSASRGMAAAGA